MHKEQYYTRCTVEQFNSIAAIVGSFFGREVYSVLKQEECAWFFHNSSENVEVFSVGWLNYLISSYVIRWKG